MAKKTRFPFYLILAILVCVLLLVPYFLPQPGSETRRDEENSSTSTVRKTRPVIEQRPSETISREAGAARKEENKRKLEEIEKLLD